MNDKQICFSNDEFLDYINNITAGAKNNNDIIEKFFEFYIIEQNIDINRLIIWNKNDCFIKIDLFKKLLY